MKDDTIDLVKFRRLKRALGLRDWAAAGVLESVWRFARKNAIMGDVGRFSNVDIAAAIDWEGDADKLIDALRDGWLDAVGDSRRLVCHDWYDHAPSYIVRRINNQLGAGDTKTATSTGRKSWRQWVENGKRTRAPDEPNAPTDGRITIHDAPTDGRNLAQNRPSSAARPEAQPNQTQPPPPTPSVPIASGEFEPVPLSAAWSEVVVVVGSCGVGAAEAACEAARDRGASPGEVRLMAEHFLERPGAWSAGLLHAMISKIRPGEKVSWPQPSSDFTERQNDLEAMAKQTKRQAEIAEQLRKRQARDAELKRNAEEYEANPVSAVEEFKAATRHP